MLIQLDGNVSLNSQDSDTIDNENLFPKIDKISTALSLPIIATYNLRSLLPKVNCLKTDILEREIDVAFLQGIWENSENIKYQSEIEKMFELNGLLYKSTPRMKGKGKVNYGGAALIINSLKYSFSEVNVSVPSGLEIIWGLLRPKTQSSKYNSIIVCSFYSPPNKYKYPKMADHICSTLHMLYTTYPDSGIILGADINSMNISSILNCGLKLRQIVDKNTRGRKVIDVIITNLST